MQLYNTMSRRKEPFVPRDRLVGVYVCGVTPYDTTHLGHAKTYVVFDALVRYLRYLGFEVRYVQNVTDVDDDILRKAREVGMPYLELGQLNTRVFVQDMDALNVQRPDHFPHATQEVPGMVEMIAALLERGCAYQAGSNVYFRVASFPDYGKLSQLSREEMLALARERGGKPDDPLKSDPLDFLLWQGAQPGEPTWASPWGPGRPGWHIECSAMSRRYLGQPVDIHGGGGDLVFPHHESEIAQTECSSGAAPFVCYWLHVGMVCLDGVKMSKSLGNMVFVRQLLKDFSPDGLRLYLLSYPYRESWDYDRAKLERTDRLAARVREALQEEGDPSGAELDPRPLHRAFLAAMDDDLDTPRAIQALHELAEAVLAGQATGQDTRIARATLHELAGILGLRGE
ncbi:MAG: cysteine--tRNA ligase [Chloroflexi bacterium]|nr:cysteine--tRNA ligase [Chloroflexota bacterium]